MNDYEREEEERHHSELVEHVKQVIDLEELHKETLRGKKRCEALLKAWRSEWDKSALGKDIHQLLIKWLSLFDQAVTPEDQVRIVHEFVAIQDKAMKLGAIGLEVHKRASASAKKSTVKKRQSKGKQGKNPKKASD